MSVYERQVWAKAVSRLNATSGGRGRELIGRATKPIASVAGKAWTKVPLNDDLTAQFEKALEGLVGVTMEPAMKSVNLHRVVGRVGVPLEDFQQLDLKQLDAASPRTRGLYTATALVEGGATALAVTGATVATTVSGGTTAAVAVGAVATDIAASIGLLGRITAVAAAEYGYDVRQPEEEIFALGTISVGSAGTPAAKVAALASLSRLTQEMMRKATWAQLNNHALVKVIDAVFKSLGLRLTHQKLGQAVPFAGVLINGGLSAQMADQTYRRARDVYRLRFLSEKYGIDPAAWITEDGAVTDAEDQVLGAALDQLESEDLPDAPPAVAEADGPDQDE
ncbi:EcsC family protein [Nocardioides carbamazepini]|uniref:EcsC family protein n=1 Tax=Nocardioides carbamazepini TaxID=2854259 RepID=UPI00214A70DA|nr:EcsC family protein [Nocardioides carbamazepini]MCR1785402.1 EcsC family protein [Nocardioides carbamazepini]